MLKHVFYYYEQHGQVCAAKAPVDDGVIIGGGPAPLVSFDLQDHEFELSLEQLKVLYPYG